MMAHAKIVSILALLSLGAAPSLAFPLAARIDRNAAAPLAARAVANPDTTSAPEVNKRAGIKLGFGHTTITLDAFTSAVPGVPLPAISVSLFRRGPLDDALGGESELLGSAGVPSGGDDDGDGRAGNEKRLIIYKDILPGDEIDGDILKLADKLVPGLEDDEDDDGTRFSKRDLIANTDTLASILEEVELSADLGGHADEGHRSAGTEKRQLGLGAAVDNINNHLRQLEAGPCDLNIPLLGECRDGDGALFRKRQLVSSESLEDTLRLDRSFAVDKFDESTGDGKRDLPGDVIDDIDDLIIPTKLPLIGGLVGGNEKRQLRDNRAAKEERDVDTTLNSELATTYAAALRVAEDGPDITVDTLNSLIKAAAHQKRQLDRGRFSEPAIVAGTNVLTEVFRTLHALDGSNAKNEKRHLSLGLGDLSLQLKPVTEPLTDVVGVGKEKRGLISVNDLGYILKQELQKSAQDTDDVAAGNEKRGLFDGIIRILNETIDGRVLDSSVPAYQPGDGDESARNKKRLIIFEDILTDDEPAGEPHDSPLEPMLGLGNDIVDAARDGKRNLLGDIIDDFGHVHIPTKVPGIGGLISGNEKDQLGDAGAVKEKRDDTTSTAALAVPYAALILADDGLDITAHNLGSLIKAGGNQKRQLDLDALLELIGASSNSVTSSADDVTGVVGETV